MSENANKEAVRLAVTNTGAALLASAAEAESRAEMLTKVRDVEGGRPYRVDVNGTPTSMESWMTQPTSIRGEVELYDVVSFAAYVNRFKNDHSLVFADERNSRFTAVLDYHEAQGSPRWLRNLAFLALVHTDEWNEWIAQNEKPATQSDFAQFLEDHISDIAEPAGATLVEIARNLEASISGKFNSALRVTDGSIKFGYTKEVAASANTKDGNVAIPTEVKLMLKPYESLPDRYPVIGKLRYRINAGNLLLWFDLFGVDEAIEEAFGDLRKNVETVVNPTIVLAGPAPKQQTAE